MQQLHQLSDARWFRFFPGSPRAADSASICFM